MSTLQQYINENPIDLRGAQDYSGGMNIQLYFCSLIKFCNDSGILTVEQLISNVDIDKITDFPHWSSALDLTRYDKILTNAYEYIRPELKSKVRCVPINWERVATHWLKLLDGDTATEKQGFFALFALPGVNALDDEHPLKIEWHNRLDDIWDSCRPNLPSRIDTQAPDWYSPDFERFDIRYKS